MQSIAEIPFIGGHLALDFINTAEERGHPQAGDVLRTPADLRLWGERYGLLSLPADSKDDRAELRRALSARELLYALFQARIRDAHPARADLDRLTALVVAAYHAASLEPTAADQLTWHWNPSRVPTIRHKAVTAAVDLLARKPSPRLKQCPGAHCGWFFLDTTKRGNRRWCSMSECGQEAKTARRRALSNPREPGSPEVVGVAGFQT